MANLNLIFASVRELFYHGYLQGFAKGQEVRLLIRVRVTGDIINILEPARPGISLSYAQMMEAIRNDLGFHENYQKANAILKRKFQSLAIIPALISWLINVLVSVFYIIDKFQSLRRLISLPVDWQSVILTAIWLAFTILMIIYRKQAGALIFKLLVWVGVRLIGLFRWFRNKRVGKSST